MEECSLCQIFMENKIETQTKEILYKIQLLKDCIETNETYIKDAGTKLAQLHSAYLNILAIIGE